jgi:hypothetical protein
VWRAATRIDFVAASVRSQAARTDSMVTVAAGSPPCPPTGAGTMAIDKSIEAAAARVTMTISSAG